MSFNDHSLNQRQGLYFLKKKKAGIGNLRDKLKNLIGRAPVFLASHDSVHDFFTTCGPTYY